MNGIALAQQPVRLQPLFGGPAWKPGQKRLAWSYGHPQTQDTLVHPQGYTTKVTSLIGGGQIFGSIDALLKRAKESVLVNMYEIQHPVLHAHRTSPEGTPGAKQQQKIIEHLIDLTKKGVKVKVILDNSYDEEKDEYHNQDTIEYLRKNGVETLTYPRDEAQINHVKLLVVDNQFAVIGGMNWGNHSPTNHDACVMLEGDDVQNLVEQIYKVDYAFSGGDIKTLPASRPIPEDKIRVLTTSPKTSPDGRQNEIFQEIVTKIDNAQHSIVAQLFVLTDKTIANKLLAAHKRLIANHQPGVRIIVDPGLYFKFKNCRPMIDYLVKQGVPVRFFKSDWEREEKLHSKWAVFDETDLMIGSANWSKVGMQSPQLSKTGFSSPLQFLKSNHEANVLIHSKELCRAFLEQFNLDWTSKSTPMQGAGAIYRMIPPAIRAKMFSFNGTKQTPPAPNVIPFPNRQGDNTVPHVEQTGVL